MRLVDRGLEALTAPSSGTTTGVAALAAVAGLAALGAAKRFHDPFKNLPIFDFVGNSYDLAKESQEAFKLEMAARGLPSALDTRVWADWAIERGELVGEQAVARQQKLPHIEVQRDRSSAAQAGEGEYIECCCNETGPVPSKDTPKVIRRLLGRLGYDGETIVPLEGWRTEGNRQQCRTSPYAQTLFVDYNAPRPLWNDSPAPLTTPYNYVAVGSYFLRLPRKKP